MRLRPAAAPRRGSPAIYTSVQRSDVELFTVGLPGRLYICTIPTSSRNSNAGSREIRLHRAHSRQSALDMMLIVMPRAGTVLGLAGLAGGIAARRRRRETQFRRGVALGLAALVPAALVTLFHSVDRRTIGAINGKSAFSETSVEGTASRDPSSAAADRPGRSSGVGRRLPAARGSGRHGAVRDRRTTRGSEADCRSHGDPGGGWHDDGTGREWRRDPGVWLSARGTRRAGRCPRAERAHDVLGETGGTPFFVGDAGLGLLGLTELRSVDGDMRPHVGLDDTAWLWAGWDAVGCRVRGLGRAVASIPWHA